MCVCVPCRTRRCTLPYFSCSPRSDDDEAALQNAVRVRYSNCDMCTVFRCCDAKRKGDDGVQYSYRQTQWEVSGLWTVDLWTLAVRCE